MSYAVADSLPDRKPGLWEIAIAGQVGGSAHPTSMKQCTDQATDSKLLQAGSEIQGSRNCSKNDIVRTSNGYSISSLCKHGGSTLSSRGSFTGDFTSEYSGEITTTFDPPMLGQSSSKTTIKAKWLGDCPNDMRPGDTVLSNGLKMNMNQAAQAAQQAAAMLNDPEVARAMKQLSSGMNKDMEKAMRQMLQQQGQPSR
jgi:hypothetical protein